MSVHLLAGRLRMAAVILALLGGAAQAQQPSASAMATGKEYLDIKGGMEAFDAVIPGVINQAKGMFLQTNTGLSKDLDEVATILRNEFAARRVEIQNEMIRAYLARFNEQELKDAIAFYKTPLGKKLLTEEPQVLRDAYGRIDAWTRRFADEVLVRFRAEMKKRGHNL